MQITIPDSPTVLEFVSPDGSPVAKIEAYDVYELIVECSRTAGKAWKPLFAERLSLLLQRKVSPSFAALVLVEANKIITDLKKNFPSETKSPSSTDSTPEVSTEDHSSPTMPTSPDYPLFERPETETPDLL